ncbi:MAG: hypothetical protein R3D70_12270 [Rhizobiaceae bacterium]
MTHFVIFSGRSTLLKVPVGKSLAAPSFEVQETTPIGFRVDDLSEDQEFRISIGDLQLGDDVPAEDFGDTIRWRAGQHLSGASGVTPISLRDAATGDVLARSLALVEPSKLSASAYEAMFADMAHQRRVVARPDLEAPSRACAASLVAQWRCVPLTARLELSQIRQFWNRLSPTLADILEDPHMELRQRRSIRRPRPGERLLPDVLRRFAQRGLGAREAVRTGALVELPTAMPDRNTRDNSVIVAFMDLLWRRVERSLKRARAERDMRLARNRSFRGDLMMRRWRDSSSCARSRRSLGCRKSSMLAKAS